MSYEIHPQECDRISRQTAVERDQLQDTLRQVYPAFDEAEGGATGPVVAELENLRTLHNTAVGQVTGRIASALANGAQAVAAYVRGDAEMAATYGRAANVFAAGDAIPPPPPAVALPELIEGP